MKHIPFEAEILRMIREVKPLGLKKISITPAASGDISAFEKAYRVEIPQELKLWLLICNGAPVNPGGIYGVRPAKVRAEDLLDELPAWRARKWFPLASNGCGDYYVVPTEAGGGKRATPVLFIDQKDLSVPAYAVASSVGHFLWFLLKSELVFQKERKVFWPFNKREVLKIDPALENCELAPLPWEV